jgi:hypothetical protein
MMQKVFVSTLAALVAAVSLVAVKVRAERKAVQDHLLAVRAIPAGSVRYGPYPTEERASQIAAYFQRQGYNAHVISWSSLPDIYYVDVWL